MTLARLRKGNPKSHLVMANAPTSSSSSSSSGGISRFFTLKNFLILLAVALFLGFTRLGNYVVYQGGMLLDRVGLTPVGSGAPGSPGPGAVVVSEPEKPGFQFTKPQPPELTGQARLSDGVKVTKKFDTRRGCDVVVLKAPNGGYYGGSTGILVNVPALPDGYVWAKQSENAHWEGLPLEKTEGLILAGTIKKYAISGLNDEIPAPASAPPAPRPLGN
jgi:hypothetical protein